MAVGRLRFTPGFGRLLSLGLSAAVLFTGCAWKREYVRRGAVLDSLSGRAVRLEQEQERQARQMVETRADILNELQGLRRSLDELDARITDQEERLARIGRKLGVWYSGSAPGPEIPADTSSTIPDSLLVRGDTLPVPVDSGIDPDQLYNTAYLDFTRGQYQVAIAGFQQFIQMFPDSDLADNAQYWIAESHYALGELLKAEEEFRKVPLRYPEGNKVVSAEYKLGLVYYAQNRKEHARKQLEMVVAKYPGTTEARLAEERLAQE